MRPLKSGKVGYIKGDIKLKLFSLFTIYSFLYGLHVVTVLNRYSESVVLLWTNAARLLKSENNCYWKPSCLMNCISRRCTSGWQKWRWITWQKSSVLQINHYNYDLDITHILVVSSEVRYIAIFDITNPRFNEQIWPGPSDSVKSRFHCTDDCTVRSTICNSAVTIVDLH